MDEPEEANSSPAFLTALPAAERTALESVGSVRTFDAGVPIVHEGDPSEHVLIVRRGCVKVVASAPGGGQLILGLRGPNDIVGEMASLQGQPRRATVIGTDQVEVLVVPGRRFLRMVAESPAMSLALARTLAGRLAENDRYRLMAASVGVAPALGQLLLDLAHRYGSRTPSGGWTLGVGLTQRDLAECLAVSTRTVARTLDIWRRKGIVTTARRAIVIASPDALRANLRLPD
jgi:CRP/FNR family transcriptional regulator, cyclic AMP receptor protein